MGMIMTYIVILISTSFLMGITVASAKDPDAVLLENIKSLEEVKKTVETQKVDKGLKGKAISSAHSTRPTEEKLNEIRRSSQQLQQTINNGTNAKAIYGLDDRKNYDNKRVTDAQRLAADATVILVKEQDLTATPDKKKYKLPSGNILDAAANCGLCTPDQAASLNKPMEWFYDEPNPGFCSGFRVGNNLIATAGHCIRTQSDCDRTRFVFGFYKTAQTPEPEKEIAADRVYSCKAIVGGKEERDGPDWRIVKVDRDMTSGSNVLLRSANMQPILKPNDAVVVIGYPMGLPAKIADGATVRGMGNGFFVANVDTYGGNSGSAVFNKDKVENGELLVEGILVRGENDFEV